jgi:excisionase family DNA binding protein
MQTEERFKLLLTAPPDTLAAVDAALAGKLPDPNRPPSLRLLRVGEFAKRSGISRCGVWRMCKENRIRSVFLRKGSRRIPEAELIRLVEGR